MMIGAKIREARKKVRLSQEDVGAKAGVARTQISKLERDDLKLDMMRWGTIQKLCAVLNMTPYDFMDDTRYE